MVDGLSRIIRENKWILGERFAAVMASLLQAFHSCEQALALIHDEHLVFLLHPETVSSHASSPDGVLVTDQCREWLERSQDGLPSWTPQRREVFNEEVSFAITSVRHTFLCYNTA